MRSLGTQLKKALIGSGTVFCGPCENVDHDKYYILAIQSKDGQHYCTVLINSHINKFIMNRKHLLDRQVLIDKKAHIFLKYDSYVDCSGPMVVKATRFESSDFSYLGTVDSSVLTDIVDNIKKSGALSMEEYEMFF